MADEKQKIRWLKIQDRDRPRLLVFFLIEGLKWLPFIVLGFVLISFSFPVLEAIWRLAQNLLEP